MPGIRLIVYAGRAHLSTPDFVSTHVAMSHRSQQSGWLSLPFGVEARGREGPSTQRPSSKKELCPKR